MTGAVRHVRATNAPGVPSGPGTVAALYVHIPFCAHKCPYCDFASRATARNDARMLPYLGKILEQYSELRSMGWLEGCDTAYVGGGTPPMLGGGLVDLSLAIGELGTLSEFSMEANPESLPADLVGELAQTPLTRVSLGVQSTDDVELAALGRTHGARDALAAVESVASSGLAVSCDLMCAIPHQSDATWRRSLADVLSAGATHVSVYPLSIEEKTPFGARYAGTRPDFNDEAVQARRMEIACDALAAAGLRRYEVASYARPGRECRHNQTYWEGRSYLGIGVAAAGMLDRTGYESLRRACPQLPVPLPGIARVRLVVKDDLDAFLASSSCADLHFSGEMLTERQAVAEDLMLGARLARGIGEDLLSRARGVVGADALDAALGRVHRSGLATREGGSLVPTRRGWLLGNELYGELWGLSEGTIATFAC